MPACIAENSPYSIRVLKGTRETASLFPPPSSEWIKTKTKAWEKEDKIWFLMIETRWRLSPAVRASWICWLDLNWGDLTTGDAAWGGPCPPPAHSLGKMVLPWGDWGLEEESCFSWMYQSEKSFLHEEGGSENQLIPGWFRKDVSSWKPKDGEEVLSSHWPVDNLQIERVGFMS